jgi:glyoxylase-like metal-dependent hydrolase (beta-lactamase superfamily II)
MPQEIKTITLPLPLIMGNVNCYLIKTSKGFILIDTGGTNARNGLESELVNAGCRPENLDLILLTHGDFDHSGNAAYLRDKFATKIAMGYDDSGMVEHGDMTWNRKKGNFLLKIISGLFFKLGSADKFKPDIYLNDGDDLSEYGYDAKVLQIPGHSLGSVGILTASGDLFCGDLITGTGEPALNTIMDDPSTANASLDKLAGYEIDTVYPGHGEPFSMQSFLGI